MTKPSPEFLAALNDINPPMFEFFDLPSLATDYDGDTGFVQPSMNQDKFLAVLEEWLLTHRQFVLSYYSRLKSSTEPSNVIPFKSESKVEASLQEN